MVGSAVGVVVSRPVVVGLAERLPLLIAVGVLLDDDDAVAVFVRIPDLV